MIVYWWLYYHAISAEQIHENLQGPSELRDSPICHDQARDDFDGGVFPRDFIWAVATASHQIEGGWRADGKGSNIWDEFTHYWGVDNNNEFNGRSNQFRCNIDGCETADVACDSYNQWERDLDLIKDMGLQSYRFSLSWARLLPTGSVADGFNQAGVNYYNKLINGALDRGILPFVTLYHWDLPADLQSSFGGWTSRKIVDAFAEYADFCFEHFGDRVVNWITLNEPNVFVDQGYELGIMAPGVKGQKWLARHHTILAHAAAYRVYDTKYRAQQNGQIGITLNTDWSEPETEADRDAAGMFMDMELGFWAKPIFVDGQYPERVVNAIKRAGDAHAEVLSFSPDESSQILHSSDFFGLNHYYSIITNKCEFSDTCKYGHTSFSCPNWPQAGPYWLKSVPWGLRHLLNHIHEKYNSEKFPIYITENGVASLKNDLTNGTDHEPNLNDHFRIRFYHNYIGQVHRAITQDHVNVKAYTAWTLMDNFEWARGVNERFGLHWMNYTDPNHFVIPKKSAKFLGTIATTQCVPSVTGELDACDKASVNDEL